MEKIDFVIPWVDGADPDWIAEKRIYKPDMPDDAVRYRDWDILKYWFRGVETYAPWVNRIHFITWGHIPEWLDTSNPKLNIVNHRDYIPEEFLPTFSSHVIELNMHRIKGLEEKFVYFNDDIFLISDTKEEDFFKDGLPVDMAVLFPNHVNGNDSQFDHILLNNAEFFDRHFNIKSVIKGNRRKWLSIKYGKNLLKTMCMLPFSSFTGLILHHQPTGYLKKTCEEVWESEPGILSDTCRNKFRTAEDVNQYVFRYWQLGKGEFSPVNIFKRGCYQNISKDTEYDKIFNSGKKIVCINDSDSTVDFDKEKARLTETFERKFPDKSSFEL